MSDSEPFGKRNHGDDSGEEDDGRSPRKQKPGATSTPAGLVKDAARLRKPFNLFSAAMTTFSMPTPSLKVEATSSISIVFPLMIRR